MENFKVAHDLDSTERTQDVIIDGNISFDSLLLSPETLAGLKACGFRKPSPIQLKAIPLGKCGFDLIVESKSGTGKTAVFGIIALESVTSASGNCQCLVLAPTREIALQDTQVINRLGIAYKDLHAEVVMGGTKVAEDISRLSQTQNQIIVGSPGRMKQLIKEEHISLDAVRLIILDEADKLLEQTFQPDINYIFSMLPERKQVIAASATYTQEMKDFLSLYMRSPCHVWPYDTRVLLGIEQYTSVVPSHLSPVRQTQLVLEELKRILSEVSFKQCLVFSNYQSKTRSTYTKLRSIGWPVQYLSSAQSQVERLESLKRLQSFSCRVLVATDLAARGIDASNVDLVINIDQPYDYATYLHRIGRAGRYGSKGIAITIVPTSDVQKLHTMLKSFNESFDIKIWQGPPEKNRKEQKPTQIAQHSIIGGVHPSTAQHLVPLMAQMENNNTLSSINALIRRLNDYVVAMKNITPPLDSLTFPDLPSDAAEYDDNQNNVHFSNMDLNNYLNLRIPNLACLGDHIEEMENRFNMSQRGVTDSRRENIMKCDIPPLHNTLIENDCIQEGSEKPPSEHQVSDGVSYRVKLRRKATKDKYSSTGSDNNLRLPLPLPLGVADEYYRWRHQLALVTHFIQQSVYMETLVQLN